MLNKPPRLSEPVLTETPLSTPDPKPTPIPNPKTPAEAQSPENIPPASRVVIDPEGGQRVLVDVLVVMAGKRTQVDLIALLKQFGGTVTVGDPARINAFLSVRFPVKNIDQLKQIKEKLIEQGIWAAESIEIGPLMPYGPQ